jgi:hypothetical protein
MAISAVDMVTPAMACLRVSILGMPEGHGTADLQALVARLINAFLETRWQPPRRFEQMTPYAFVLSDPNASKMDKRAMKALAAELQIKLFGAEGEGEVSLLVFEGSEIEVHRFAHLPISDVTRFMDGESLDPPFEGVLDRITADRRIEAGLGKSQVLVRAAIQKAKAPPEAFDDLEVSAPRAAPAPAPRRYEPLFSGLYLTVTQTFIGNTVLCRRGGSRRIPSLLDAQPIPDVSVEAFDEGCVEAAAWALSQGGVGGLLFVPLSFSSLVRPAGRRAYARFLCHLPAEHRARLGAAIYDTPRDPSFFALTTICRFLDPFIGEINLHVSDPDFEIDKLPSGKVGSVTLTLPDRDPVVRMADARRFLLSRELFKKKRVWPGVDALLNQSELDTCLGLRMPVISGPAVAPIGKVPVAARGFDIDRLPMV